MDVSSVARGYLSLINANNRGQGISLAADYITPVVDVTAMLGANKRGFAFGVNTMVPGTSSYPLLTIPTGEVWIIRAGGLSFVAAATSIANRVQGWMRPPGTQNQVEVPYTEASGSVTGPAGGTYMPWIYPGIVLEAGTEFHCTGFIQTANTSVTLGLMFDRLSG